MKVTFRSQEVTLKEEFKLTEGTIEMNRNMKEVTSLKMDHVMINVQVTLASQSTDKIMISMEEMKKFSMMTRIRNKMLGFKMKMENTLWKTTSLNSRKPNLSSAELILRN
jgi:hypothetical protein